MKHLIVICTVCLFVVPALALQKNVASQKIGVYAYDDTTGDAKTGDAAQITSYVWQDWASGAASNDVNPTELDSTNAPGMYVFDMLQAETNADVVCLYAVSSTSNIKIHPVVIHTTPADFPDEALATEAKQDIIDTNVDDIKGYTDDIGIAGAGLTAIDLPNQTMDIVGDITGNLSGSVGSLTGHTVQTGDSYAIVSNGTYGLSALKTLIDALNNLSAQQVWEYATREVDMTKVHGTAITETTGGRIAGNLSTFWDNADAVTTKTVDDIGGTATIPPRIE